MSPARQSPTAISSLQGQASWEPDLWGSVRRSVEAARSNAQASAADLANVELSIRAELATDYFEMRGLDTDQKLLDDTVVSYRKSYDLTVNRKKGGVATESDVSLAETQLQSTISQSIDVGVARAQYEHAIATLIGVPASSFSLPRAAAESRASAAAYRSSFRAARAPPRHLHRRTPGPGRQCADRHRHRRLLSERHPHRWRRL